MTSATVRPARTSRTFIVSRAPRSPRSGGGCARTHRSMLTMAQGARRAAGEGSWMQRVTAPGRMRRFAVGLGLALCGMAGAARAADAVLDIWAAASLREPVTLLARRFEAQAKGRRVNLVFGASSALARQIQGGAPADVFLSADDLSVDRLQA